MSQEQNQSEVARLRKQIKEEYESAHSGLHGLAQGTSQHAIITRRMERIGELVEELKKISVDEAHKALEEMDKGGQL